MRFDELIIQRYGPQRPPGKPGDAGNMVAMFMGHQDGIELGRVMKKYYDVIELACDLGKSVEEIIRYGAAGDLTLSVIADEWHGKKVDNPDAVSDFVIDGHAELAKHDESTCELFHARLAC